MFKWNVPMFSGRLPSQKTGRSPSVGLMLNIKPALGKRLVFAGYVWSYYDQGGHISDGNLIGCHIAPYR